MNLFLFTKSNKKRKSLCKNTLKTESYSSETQANLNTVQCSVALNNFFTVTPHQEKASSLFFPFLETVCVLCQKLQYLLVLIKWYFL